MYKEKWIQEEQWAFKAIRHGSLIITSHKSVDTFFELHFQDLLHLTESYLARRAAQTVKLNHKLVVLAS